MYGARRINGNMYDGESRREEVVRIRVSCVNVNRAHAAEGAGARWVRETRGASASAARRKGCGGVKVVRPKPAMASALEASALLKAWPMKIMSAREGRRRYTIYVISTKPEKYIAVKPARKSIIVIMPCAWQQKNININAQLQNLDGGRGGASMSCAAAWLESSAHGGIMHHGVLAGIQPKTGIYRVEK